MKYHSEDTTQHEILQRSLTMQFTTNMFGQILHIVPWTTFNRMVYESQAEHCSKGGYRLGFTKNT